ncbi:hypothetical protein [Botrimarina mediterranea]|uniref:Uncharacterized protein n=1 Tax=Botrimarina mediterranea TaxID=2528022 RepID=A0A518K3J1_9BACT|nr:hypothetical protein [Botrimarina mediterranea]QDV72349.1 hypothetical protein Spa11_05230 [Botrimarina mediterranea]QDV76895.1 hypothetical protein K2D_04780 [Planctomycetes bacterium K2D]
MDGDKGDGLPVKTRPKLTAEFYEWAADMTRIGNDGVRRAGVPYVYSINGVLHWELPDGSLTTVDPWQGKTTPPDDAGTK